MNYIKYKGNDLLIENVKISDLVQEYKRPFYCYSASYIENQYLKFASAQKLRNTQISYAVKANSNLSVLKLLSNLGAGADVVSLGELERALRVGIPPQKIVFSGVGKTLAEISYAIKIGIGQINIESVSELYFIAEVAKNLEKIANISIRINPDVNALTHAKISTGERSDKFGIIISNFRNIINFIRDCEFLHFRGLSCHIGSQIRSISPYRESYLYLRDLVDELQAASILLDTIDLGGGIGISYDDLEQDDSEDFFLQYADMVYDIWQNYQDFKFIFEPGRSIVGNSGILIAKILYCKPVDEDNNFIIIDAGMNDLMRPALYSATHQILPIFKGEGELHNYHIVGPICESSDVFVRNYQTNKLQEGAFIAILSSGAYGYSMANEYNTKPLAQQFLVRGNNCQLIGRGSEISDILERDILLDFADF